MGIGAARPEGRDAGNARPVGGRLPVAQCLLQVERGGLQRQVGIEPGRMQARRDLPVLELQDHLADAGDPGRRLQVADVRLDRPQRTAAGRDAVHRESVAQSAHLDRIAQLGSGTVCLDIADPACVEPRPFDRQTDHPRLRLGIGHGVAVGLAAMVDRRGADHRMDVVPVRQRLRQRLQQHDADPLAGDKAVAALTEAAAAAVLRQHLAGAQLHIGGRMQVKVDTAGERHAAFAAAQAFASPVQRGQRRRAHGVHRLARSVQPQDIRDPVGGRAERGARKDQVPLLAQRGAIEAVSRLGDSREDPDIALVALGQRCPGDPGIFQGMPAGLQEQPLLRIHVDRLAGRDIEEQRIEFGEAIDEAAPLAVAPAQLHRLLHRVDVKILQRPALRRNLGDAVAPRLEVVPVRVEVGGLGVAAADPDHRDRLDRRRRRSGCRAFVRRARLRRLAVAVLSACQAAPQQAGETMPLHQVAGQRIQTVVLKEQRLRQLALRRPQRRHPGEGIFQRPVEPGDHDRIDTVLFQRHVGLDTLGREPGDIAEHRLEPLKRGGGQPVAVHVVVGLRRRGCLHAVAGRGRCFGIPGSGKMRADPRQIALDHQQPFQPLAQSQLQRPETMGRLHRRHPGLAADRGPVVGADLHAAVLPERVVDRQRMAEALPLLDPPVALAGEMIHECVGGGVVRLAHAAQRRRAGGKQNEEIQVEPAARPVQQLGADHLGGEDIDDVLGGFPGQQPIPVDARAMQHTVQAAVLGADPVDQPFERFGIGQVDPVVADLGAGVPYLAQARFLAAVEG